MIRFVLINLVALHCALGLGFAESLINAQESLERWEERQQKIQQVIKRVQPCVIAVGGGAGVIVSEVGHVLTVSHVAGTAGRRVTVQMSDGTTAMATMLGSNANLDIAALKLDEDKPWPFLQVHDLSIPSNSDVGSGQPVLQLTATKIGLDKRSAVASRAELEDGQWCLAFGYPLSFERGKPSVVRLGKIRLIEDRRITSSTAIMGGDSGGPLVDLEGQLIGISSRVKTDIGSNLHVPTQVFRDHWEQLLSRVDVARAKKPKAEESRSARPWLGVYGDTDESRVRLRKVQLGSPADLGGLKPEDVILSFDEKDVTKFSDVVELLQSRKPTDVVTLSVNRYGTILELSVKLGARP